MAEEEKKEGQGEAEQASDTQQDQTDYRKLYEEQQGKYQQVLEQNKRNEEMLDQLTPFVRWDEISGQGSAKSETESQEDEKSITQKLNQIEQKVDNSLAAIQFRIANPDLAQYESLVVSEMAAVRGSNPRLTRAQLLKKAGDNVRQFLESEREKGKKQAEETNQKRKDELEKASGLGSARDTAPESHEGETKQQYVDSRRKRLEQMKTPAGAKG